MTLLTAAFFQKRAELCAKLAMYSEIPEIKARLLALAEDYQCKMREVTEEQRTRERAN